MTEKPPPANPLKLDSVIVTCELNGNSVGVVEPPTTAHDPAGTDVEPATPLTVNMATEPAVAVPVTALQIFSVPGEAGMFVNVITVSPEPSRT